MSERRNVARGCINGQVVAFSFKGAATDPGPMWSVETCLGMKPRLSELGSFDCGVDRNTAVQHAKSSPGKDGSGALPMCTKRAIVVAEGML